MRILYRSWIDLLIFLLVTAAIALGLGVRGWGLRSAFNRIKGATAVEETALELNRMAFESQLGKVRWPAEQWRERLIQLETQMKRPEVQASADPTLLERLEHDRRVLAQVTEAELSAAPAGTAPADAAGMNLYEVTHALAEDSVRLLRASYRRAAGTERWINAAGLIGLAALAAAWATASRLFRKRVVAQPIAALGEEMAAALPERDGAALTERGPAEIARLARSANQMLARWREALRGRRQEVEAVAADAAQMKRRLYESERERQFQQSVVDQAPEGCAVFEGAEMRLKWANRVFLGFLEERFRGVEVHGMRLEELVPWLGDGETPAIVREVASTRKPHVAEAAIARPGAGRKTTWWRWRVMALGEGEPPDLMLHLTEVTAEVQARRQIEELAASATEQASRQDAIFGALTDMVLVLDAAGKVIKATPTAVAGLGFDPVGCEHKVLPRMLELRTPDGKPITPEEMAMARALQGETTTNVKHRLTNVQGKMLIVMASAAPFHHLGRISGAVVALHDVTEREELMEQLAGERARFESVLQKMPAGALIAEAPSGRIILANAEADRIVGCPFPKAESLEQYGDYPVYHPDGSRYAPREMPLVRALTAGETVENEEFYFYYAGAGDPVTLSVSAAPIFDAGGQIIAATTIFHDVTAQKRAAAERERLLAEIESRRRLFEMVMENAPLGIAIMSGEDLRIKWGNKAFKHCLDPHHQGREIVGLTAGELLPEADREAALAVLRKVAASGEPSELREYPMAGFERGETYWHWVTLPLPEGQGTPDLVLLLGDVTEQTRGRKQLEELAARLEEMNQTKDNFLATLGHELRNPLAPIQNSLYVLRERGPLNEAQSHFMEIIERQVRQMARLVDDLLDISRISRGKIELKRERVALGEVVRRAVESTATLFENRRHNLTLDLPSTPLELKADPARLEQILINLLNNAAKYTEPGGQVWLRAERRDEEIIIEVRDTGIGVEPSLLPRLFEPFRQVEGARQRSQGGLGLGLALVRSLVELHGGAVEIQSPGVGLGTSVILRLPALPAEARPPEAKRPPVEAGQGLRVLVVEDNADTAASLSDLLTLWGHQTMIAPDGYRALELAPAWAPEVVLLDIGLPGMDGYQVAQKLRQAPETAAALLIAASGYGQSEDRALARQAGIDHHFTKPIDLERLQKLLAAHAQRRAPKKSG